MSEEIQVKVFESKTNKLRGFRLEYLDIEDMSLIELEQLRMCLSLARNVVDRAEYEVNNQLVKVRVDCGIDYPLSEYYTL